MYRSSCNLFKSNPNDVTASGSHHGSEAKDTSLTTGVTSFQAIRQNPVDSNNNFVSAGESENVFASDIDVLLGSSNYEDDNTSSGGAAAAPPQPTEFKSITFRFVRAWYVWHRTKSFNSQ